MEVARTWESIGHPLSESVAGYISRKTTRDIEKVYSGAEFAAKLRRLADAIEEGATFEIQIAGERIHVPSETSFSVEHERDDSEEEIEFQLKWETK